MTKVELYAIGKSTTLESNKSLPYNLLLSPGCNHSLLAFRTNAIEISQAFGHLLNDIEDLRAEGLGQLLGKVWANAFDHP